MKETLELELSLEHLNKELIDICCEVEVDPYSGSNTSDDPSELEILSITNTNQIDSELNGSILLYAGENLKIDSKLEEQIINKYERLQNK